ncbi:MAG: HAMP domain-containing histidine kinase [Caulobacteraceae bacterium]|nr:HAMP domain-containing histidine kinase [Caulobacteraceae bacterium]
MVEYLPAIRDIAISFAAIALPIGALFYLARSAMVQNRTLHYVEEFRFRDRDSDSYNREILSEILRRLEASESFQERRLQASLRDFIGVISEAIDSRLSAQAGSLAASLAKIEQIQKPDRPQIESRDQSSERLAVAREIAHALLTPLARIDAISRKAKGTSGYARELESVGVAVRICFNYLNAFRNVSHSDTPSDQSAPFTTALERAATIYVEQAAKDVKVRTVGTPSVTGIADYFVMASVLPLIENAIDASQAGDEVVIDVSEDPGHIFVDVTNNIYAKFPGKKAFELGYTTKSGHGSHEGLGLGIVKSLVSSVGGEVSFETKAGKITFSVRLPRRK